MILNEANKHQPQYFLAAVIFEFKSSVYSNIQLHNNKHEISLLATRWRHSTEAEN